jgi:hypothetical protein
MLTAFCHIRVDRLEGFVDVTKGFVETFRSLGLDALEGLSGLGSILFRLLVVRVTLLETLRNRRESFACLFTNGEKQNSERHVMWN